MLSHSIDWHLLDVVHNILNMQRYAHKRNTWGCRKAVASPMLKNWPLFGQKLSKFGQSIQLHSHVSEVVSIFQTEAK